MSGILAVLGDVGEHRLAEALVPLRRLGGEREQVWRHEDTLLFVTRKSWQLDEDFSGNVLVLETPRLVVASDASLFDKQRLARTLSAAGTQIHGDTASHLIEAAYRAWGPSLVEHLNGDFAFVIWDRRDRRLLAARDAMGWRPLFWASLPSGVAIASSSRALAELRGSAGELNLAALGAQAAGLAWSNGTDTAYRGVEAIRPGRMLTWKDGDIRHDVYWSPRSRPDLRPAPAAEAAEELRELLSEAVARRLSAGTSTVWMSGGWDSTAVFAAGQAVLPADARRYLRPVSISYPPRDPGCEDLFINQVAEHWSAEICWLRSDDLPLLDGLVERAAESDEPPAHLYELWNRGLARGTRSVDSRIALDGSGGDQLFQVSDVIVADLLRTGRWLDFAAQARAWRRQGWRHLARVGVLPFVPDALVRGAERVLGRRLPRHYLERTPTGWVRTDFVSTHRLRERDLDLLRSVHGKSVAHSEALLYLTMPVWGWSASFMRGALLQEGVEVRSPLLDLNVVEFALGRPTTERFDGKETKQLLRRAMEGLLPENVLAPRAYRTGITAGYSRKKMQEAYPELVQRLFAEPLRLADLGIVDPRALRRAADSYFTGEAEDSVRVSLFHTMKIEFWLRGHESRRQVAWSGRGLTRTVVNSPAA